MGFLPGWTRDRLLTAPPEDVAAARLIVFTMEVKPVLQRDYAGELDDLRERTPAEVKMYERRRRGQAAESLISAMRLQADLRRQLGLDDDA